MVKVCIDCGKRLSVQYATRCRKCRDVFNHGINHVGYRHGLAHTRFNHIYKNILARCNKPKTPCFNRYGGKGIQCLWKSFEKFRNDMHESYLEHVKEFGEKNTQIDRIDSKGNYFKENCRWVTIKEQMRNMSTNNRVTFQGETLPLVVWAEKLNLSYNLLRQHITRDKWSIKKAFNYKK